MIRNNSIFVALLLAGAVLAGCDVPSQDLPMTQQDRDGSTYKQEQNLQPGNLQNDNAMSKLSEMATTSLEDMTPEQLRGTEVTTLDHELVGVIVDVLKDQPDGQSVVWIDLSESGDLGEKVVEIPLSALRQSPNESSLQITMTLEQLKNAPEVEQEKARAVAKR